MKSIAEQRYRNILIRTEKLLLMVRDDLDNAIHQMYAEHQLRMTGAPTTMTETERQERVGLLRRKRDQVNNQILEITDALSKH